MSCSVILKYVYGQAPQLRVHFDYISCYSHITKKLVCQ